MKQLLRLLTGLTRKFIVKLTESGKHNDINKFSRVLDRRISKEKKDEETEWTSTVESILFVGINVHR